MEAGQHPKPALHLQILLRAVSQRLLPVPEALNSVPPYLAGQLGLVPSAPRSPHSQRSPTLFFHIRTGLQPPSSQGIPTRPTANNDT